MDCKLEWRAQSLHNPSSAGSGTDYCSQTPEEMRAEQGGGWGVERDASVIQSRGPVCTHIYQYTYSTYLQQNIHKYVFP
ncbi:hypothetical protein KUCAC02_002683 [Chaenocephalus aceratus]|uniref:Uncharacterized protein n=1 Tax=Chaenocephalus aceratus TaxID=36190 RepID=A0ACB9XUE1_CHAAC|nr:hypothetical protein KUCAC02_002683 [Chaenocephalus aceratus]